METKQALNLIVRHARPMILQSFRPESCIVSTAIACDVLSFLDVPVIPMVVQVGIYNPKLTERIKASWMPDEATAIKWRNEDGCYGVSLGFVDTPPNPENPKPWPGHLVAISPTFLMDLSIDQAARQQHSIFLEPFWVPWSEETTFQRFITGKDCVLSMDNGTSLVYTARPTDRSFMKSPDWNQFERRSDIVADLLRLMKRAEL